MEEQIEARVAPTQVWQAWERAHEKNGGLDQGRKGKAQFKYKILDVKKGESFSILWKSLFVRLIFRHSVLPSQKGSLISYQVQIKGPFAWFVRWLIGEKIKKNVSAVLKAMVRELEEKGIVEASRR